MFWKQSVHFILCSLGAAGLRRWGQLLLCAVFSLYSCSWALTVMPLLLHCQPHRCWAYPHQGRCARSVIFLSVSVNKYLSWEMEHVSHTAKSTNIYILTTNLVLLAGYRQRAGPCQPVTTLNTDITLFCVVPLPAQPTHTHSATWP